MTPQKFINFSDWLDKSTGHEVIFALADEYDITSLYLTLKEIYDSKKDHEMVI